MRKVVGALTLVALFACLLTFVTLSALAVQVPTSMPFGLTGSSPVFTAAESGKMSGEPISFVTTTYPDQAAATSAIEQGAIYGAYVTGETGDTLLVAPAKSFFATVELVPLFSTAAKQLGQPLEVQEVVPLPKDQDPIGAVVGLLLLPLVIGGLFAAILVFKSTRAAAQHWRVAILLGYSVVGALLTLTIAGPWLGAFASDRFWPLLPAMALVEVTVALVSAALIALLPTLPATLSILLVFVVVGLPTAGFSGTALMPAAWQTIGGLLPPQHGADLIQNVLYFSSNNIAVPIGILSVYALAAAAVLGYLGWRRRDGQVPAVEHGSAPMDGLSRPKLAARLVLGALLVVALEQCLFAANYMSSGHNPVSNEMPFAVVGDSALTGSVQKTMSLNVTSYSDESAAKTAIDEGQAWGALISSGAGNSTLLVVPTISDLAPLDLATQFEEAAKNLGQQVTVTAYMPEPLAAGDPLGIVLSMLLTPLLVCGYMAATVLRTATGVAAGRYRGLILLAYATVTSLLLTLIVGAWFGAIPSGSFWTVWPIMGLALLVVGLFAAVMQRFLGAAGTLLTMIVIVLFGKPSSGGANGAPYLPDFWNSIGPYLPPRNIYVLLRNTVYFDGNGIGQSLAILIAYLVVFAAILGVLDWYRRPPLEVPVTHETEVQAAASAVPAGVAF